MKTIGLIGGMSWESSLEYYRLINQMVKTRLGGFHSAQCLMYSVDFAEIQVLQASGAWDQATVCMIDAAQRLERGGADCIVLCTNTMHRMADEVQAAVKLPLLHIVDSTAVAVQNRGFKRVGLLGTMYTMTSDIYAGRFKNQYGLELIIPDETTRQEVHRIIYDELVLGKIKAESRAAYVEAITQLAQAGAEGVILGCTEIELLIKPEDSPLPAFDTTYLHAQAAVDFALS